MRILRTAAILAALAIPAAAWAQDSLELKGSGWVNARDISLERLKGKVVVVYFYEET
ncbi:MAG TPA: hypothetical protein VNM14_07445 [Planctomycetota bacterium]|jgi:hypothetical protein|nr:hypothetical protein [Planctomycetota bacterium]